MSHFQRMWKWFYEIDLIKRNWKLNWEVVQYNWYSEIYVDKVKLVQLLAIMEQSLFHSCFSKTIVQNVHASHFLSVAPSWEFRMPELCLSSWVYWAKDAISRKDWKRHIVFTSSKCFFPRHFYCSTWQTNKIDGHLRV
jgi:hypothetical protein